MNLQPWVPMVQDLISLSAVLLYVIPVIGYALTSNFIHIKGLIGLFTTMVLGESIKHYIIKESSPRPKGAYNCNLWCNDGAQEGKPGMPSGHSSQVAFFASFYYEHTQNIWARAGLILYALLVMISRYVKRCHTIPQIATGALLGWTMSRCVR
jgi:membrane-associated phospholipid phosphatase